ncbi:inactive protein RESTRICTED TEV MOVEMENT 1-like [Nicotiana sylvestris]|uniref:Inactive protein RESTRICTED TEV MOVEMENT 1-like n=1 Tax=Nicotiana sylvestris TaxID=4096 RepID=A0A1U7YYI7_NICSY|nr:PREDICTED: inactive protein RESTRICTED TEV MOVEMENT 1-like [Nicotiana sylvestris]
MNMIKVGPVGGQEGTVQFLFVESGNFVLSDIHGAAHNKNFTKVVLDYPSEFLTWVSGSYHGTGNDRSFGGIYGTKTDQAIESIGVYVKPITSSMITSTGSRVKVKREEED